MKNSTIKIILQFAFAILLGLVFNKIGFVMSVRPFQTIFSAAVLNGFAFYLLKNAFPEGENNEEGTQEE